MERKKRRVLSRIIAIFLALCMCITYVPAKMETVEAATLNGYDVANYANSLVGIPKPWDLPYGYCQSFVYRVFAHFGVESSACCAYNYSRGRIVSTSMDNIPVGADVFFSGSSESCDICGNMCGHVGIYVGDGWVVHLIHGVEKTQLRTLNSWSNLTYIGWGYHGGVTLSNATPPKPTCGTPSVSVSDIRGGKYYRIKAGQADTINYTILKDGQTYRKNTAHGAFDEEIIQPGKYTVSAYASRSGYNNSGTVKKEFTVSKAATPGVRKSITDKNIVLDISSATAGATIYYTTSGGTPNITSLKYSGSLSMNTPRTVKAIAVKDGYVNSDVMTYEVKLEEPKAPSGFVLNDDGLVIDNKVAVGKQVSVKWDKVEDATSYTVSLYKNGSKIKSSTTSGTAMSFSLSDVGKYQIHLFATNFVGNSEEAYPPINVEAMAPVTATFVDYDGSVIKKQEVSYGENAELPSDPERRGYNFVSWENGDKIEKMTSDVTVKATYKIITYTIKFYDGSGTQVGSTQKVDFGGAAVSPENDLTDIPTGYVFAGWKVLEADNDSAGDYTNVDSNMKLQAVYYWGNKDLPVVTEITSAMRNSETGNYNIGVKLTNYPDSATTAILRVSLMTKDGKMVKTGKSEIEIPADKSIEETITLKYSGVASVASVVLLGLDGNDLTGSAYSKEVTRTIIEQSDTTWSEWSEWGEEVLESSDDTEVEKVTEYRFRDKETTTSTAASLDGWTKYDSKTTYGNWGAWSGYSPTAQSKSDTKDVQTKTYYRYFWYYCPSCGRREPLTGWSDCGRYNLTSANFNTQWIDWSYAPTDSHHVSYATNICYTDILTGDGNRRYFAAGNIYDTAPGTKDANGSGATVIATWYSYRTRTKTTTNYFYKWDNWSDWSTNEVIATDDKEVETRTVYRKRTKVPVYSALAGTEEEGKSYSFKGKLSSVDADLKDKLATVMVYKGKNTDPNEDQIQYVGQTVIGADNAYDFNVIPKTEPTDLTGDFTVCLGLEGSTGLVMIGTIKAPKAVYSVKYVDSDGSIISDQNIEAGENAVVPQSPSKDGYVFVGWSANAMNVQSNMTVSAVYSPLTYVIAFVDGVNSVISFENHKYGDEIVPPTSPSAPGRTFKGWDILLEGKNTVTESMVANAVYDTDTFIVTFVDDDGAQISKQIVEYGCSAMPPTAPEATGKEFMGWSTDEEWWNVTKNVTVKPIFAYAETVSAPTYEASEFYDEVALSFDCSTENAEIYYMLAEEKLADHGKDDADAYVYSEPVLYDGNPIQLTNVETSSYDDESGENVVHTIKARAKVYAVSPNMNDSEVQDILYESEYVTAKNGEKECVISFNPNGGSKLLDNERCVEYNGSITNMPVPEYDDYDFVGWYTDKTEGTLVDETTKFTKSATLYAHWKEKINDPVEYIITLDSNGGKNLSINTVTVLEGETIGELPTTTRDGYDFAGWFTDKDNGEKVDKDFKVSENITLYAHWNEKVPVDCTVIFDVNGGNALQNNARIVKSGSVIGELPVPTRDNYAFIGWYTDKDAGTQVFSDNIVEAGIKLYAHWTEASHVHNIVDDPAKEATCTSTGLTAGKHCSTCGEIIVKQEVIPVKEHTWDEGVKTKESTCNADGIILYTCTVCKQTKKEPVSKLGHDWNTEYTIDKEATCTEAGSKSIHCKHCEATTDVQTIDALGHKYEKVITPATPDADGIIVEKCTVCNESKEVAVISRMKTILVSDVTYTGKELKPTVIIKDANGQLISSDYYDLVYSNNIEVGIGIVTIIGKNYYSGKIQSAFNINASQDKTNKDDKTEQPTTSPTVAPTEKPAEKDNTNQDSKKEDGVGTISADGKTLTDEDGTKYLVADKVTIDQLDKNVSIADKKSGKYKITKVTKKNGKVTGGTVAYTKPYNKNCKTATVKDKVKIAGVTFKITSISINAFKGCNKLTKVTIGKNVTQIGKNAFNGCSSLKNVIVKATNLKKIGSRAFEGINSKAKFKLYKKKYSKYKKMIKKAKAPKTSKYTK